ncbi:hypothetical protein FHQ22_07705 [Pasteurellaceae bacterium Phil31]|nr:hypothetical protein FHQ22_07705 [Pasteurellaceae bacterium Phil31]
MQRNKDNYVKYSTVSHGTINKFKGMLADELTWIQQPITINGLLNPREKLRHQAQAQTALSWQKCGQQECYLIMR